MTQSSDNRKPWLPPPDTRLGASRFVRRDFPWLPHYLDLPDIACLSAGGIGGVVGWGGRTTARLSRSVAQLRRLPYWSLEDGFLRSVGLGKARELPLSIIVDDIGMAIDARMPSRLERLISASGNEAAKNLGRDIREAVVLNKVSKYNHLPHLGPALEPGRRRRLLLVDQVVGDASVGRAFGSSASFTRMLDDAVRSGCDCLVRTHPDVMAGFRKGYLTKAAAHRRGLTMLSDHVSAASILEVVDEVWTVSSQFGFDALLWGVPVCCYAAPFYAGWGLTTDRFSERMTAAITRRHAQPRTIDQLTAAVLGYYPIYRNPEDWRPINVFEAIELIVAGQRDAHLV